MHMVLMIAVGIILAIVLLPLVGFALPFVIIIGALAVIIASICYVISASKAKARQKKETEERLSKMSEEERQIEEAKIKLKERDEKMSYIVTGVVILIIWVVVTMIN